jgi:hypothetical protein
VIGLEIKSFRANLSPLFDRGLKQPPADSGPLVRRLDSHLGYFKFFVAQTNQRAAADALFTGSSEENTATRIQNSSLRIGQDDLLLWLYTEESGDPFFIEPSECSSVPQPKLSDADLDDRRGLFFSESHMRNPPSSFDDRIPDRDMSNI